MPQITSTYKRPILFANKHIETIYPALFRPKVPLSPDTQRLELPDGDFVDLDWYKTGSDKLIILSHGLEGDARRPYTLWMVKRLLREGWDVLAWNYRSCSGEMNRLLRFYHSGDSEDLRTMLNLAVKPTSYKKLALVGFSVGGNITLKYLGEQGEDLDNRLVCAVTFSVPCDLASGAEHLAKFQSKIYMNRFMKSLKHKVKEKAKLHPGKLSVKELDGMTTFRAFDEIYTAPLHGFKNAEEYWRKNSSRFFIPNIKIPVLLVSAENDPFLTKECYPVEAAGKLNNFFLEIPAHGGHCGFAQFDNNQFYWSEDRCVEFIQQYL